jgi:lactate permease
VRDGGKAARRREVESADDVAAELRADRRQPRALSALVAAVPVLVLFVMLGVRRKPAWMAALTALAVALTIGSWSYGCQCALALMATLTGAAYGVFPIAWIVFASIMLYRLAVDTGKFAIIKDSVGGLTDDRRLQALFIAFLVRSLHRRARRIRRAGRVSGAMLVGLGFSPFYAAGICLMANTAPVAFGSIGIPVTTLAGITGCRCCRLSAMVGRLCAMISLVIPMYLVVVMAGWRRTVEVMPASSSAASRSRRCSSRCRTSWAGADRHPQLAELHRVHGAGAEALEAATTFHLAGERRDRRAAPPHGRVSPAWSPYLLLVVFVLVWGTCR